jgi:deferrochelatase/peroxidase EfeB
MTRLTRRQLFGLAGSGAAVAAVGGAAAASRGRSGPAAGTAAPPVPFHGEHQAGIVTPAQDRLHFAVFDVTTGRRAELVGLLRAWTEAAARMTAGRDAGPVGAPLLPANAHVRLAHPSGNDGARLLRRGYSFVDGSDGLGRLDAGLFFLAFQRDPRRQFVPIRRRLAAADGMNEYIRHTGSALFACPPGVRPGGFLGEAPFS